MQVSQVSLDDGRQCAVLLQLLKGGRWDLSGDDAQRFVDAKKWVASLAASMASQLKTPESPPTPAPPGNGFKVVGMGPIGSSKPGKKKRK